MELQIYNTLTRQKEIFKPLHENKVGMYSCGPTVYSAPSIGNLRATFTADLIRNTLKLLGYDVTAVMNITDVGHLVSDGDDGEDKMEKGSRREGKSARDIAKEYETIFKKNMEALNIDEFDVMPRATDHIKEQIELIKAIRKRGEKEGKIDKYAYIIEDGVYMDTSNVEDYGELMGPNYKKRIADLQAGQRVDMKGKKNATDFALWKFSPEGEKRQMEWIFGGNRSGLLITDEIILTKEEEETKGFPGWHAECSAMSSKYLGHQFDIHHGGADHITIHHPNEIAQSECAFGVKPWVKYRVHNEFLQVDGGKMSKSLGNVYTLDDIVKKGYSPLDLRYFYFMAQYGNFQNFTWDGLDQAKLSRKSLIKKIYTVKSKFPNINKDFSEQEECIKNINFAILDNMNTPLLLSEIHLCLNDIISNYIMSKIGDINYDYNPENMLSFLSFLEDNFLKLGLFEKEETLDIPSKIIELAKDRLKAKEQKNYALADELRNKINLLNREIKDTKEGYEITKI